MSGGRGSHTGDDDLYGTLGVPAGASDEEITRAYRRLAREHHPDTNPDAGGGAFSGLTDAYDVLRDPDRRRAYDRTRGARSAAADAAAGVRIPVHHVTPAAPAGSAASARGRSEPVGEVELALTFDQAALGTRAVVPVRLDGSCRACGGTGLAASSAPGCPECGGAGIVVRRSGGINIRTSCSRCDGSGRMPAGPCPRCGGTGHVTDTDEVVVEVPAGANDGARLRVPIPGTAEHLVAVVRAAPHPYFARRDEHLTLRVPVTIAEAALGAVVSIPTLTGAVAVRIPAGTPHGRTMRVRGRGIPHPDGPGDLLITIDIVIPTDLNDRQRAALEAFADATTVSPRAHFETPAPKT